MSKQKNLSGSPLLESIIGLVAILMIAYHIVAVWVPMFNALLHQNIHLGFSLILLFLVSMRAPQKRQKVPVWSRCSDIAHLWIIHTW